MSKENISTNIILTNLRDNISKSIDLEFLYENYRELIKCIYNNKMLIKEFNIRILTFEKMQKKNEFKEQLKLFIDKLESKKEDFSKRLPTDDVSKIFYFPTMARMAVYPPYYDSVYPKPYNGTFELYYALQSINKIGLFPKEVFEETKDCIDFYILRLLADYILLPQHIGSVRLEEYCYEKTLYRIDDGEDKFLICWLKAVLLGVLNQLMIYSKTLSEFENTFPVVLHYFQDTNCFKLDDEDFNLTHSEKETLKEITSSSQRQIKNNATRKQISNINKKARDIICTNIISCKNKEKLYRIIEKVVTYQD